MKLYKVEIWVKDNEWRTVIVVGKNNVDAIDKALDTIEEDSVIDAIETEIEEVDGYKIIVK